MIFEFDRWVDGRPYPNLARWQAQPRTPEWRQFSQHWPFSEPPMLIEYLADEGITGPATDIPRYLVALSWFDFSIDWPRLLPADRLLALRDKRLIMIFYYSEGDNPARIWSHLHQQFHAAGVAADQLRLVSANSSAEDCPHSAWFADDELLYRKRNRDCPPVAAHDRPRQKSFTALVRTHKWWRATVMSDFWRRGWHEHSYFSYNPAVSVGDTESDNPIEVDRFEGLRAATHEFLRRGFTADSLTSDEHNDHHLAVPEHYNDAYINIVIETHMDADQSGGAFITEKTFKPIKNAQPFVIFGAAGSLARLRDLGYRTFDGVIDNQYDSIQDTTGRYHCLMQLLEDLLGSNLHALYQACVPDLLHNQRHFLAHKRDRLNSLLEQI